MSDLEFPAAQPPDSGPFSGPPPLPLQTARSLVMPACVVLAGVIVIAAMAFLETQQQSDQVWRNALMSISGDPPWDGVYTLHARYVPDENFPPSRMVEEMQQVEGGPEVVQILGLEVRERIAAIELPADVVNALTVSGRPPDPGKREVLAGQLCRLDEFTIDGEPFTVTGRLQRGASGMAITYLLPYDESVAPLFTDDAGATTGWFDPDGMLRDYSEEETAALEGDSQQLVFPIAPTTRTVAWGGMVGIVLVTIGGALFQVRLLSRFARDPIVGPIIAPMREFPALFRAIHVLCYGALMGAALLAFAMPLLNLQVLTFVAEIFTTGDLRHLGDAYMSGNVASAAWFTFWNNYVVVTLGWGMVPSLVVPFWGLFKTMLNLAVAGFALAPLWTDMLARFTYHSITLSLEVEAYVIAAFGVCLYPLYIWRAFHSENARDLLAKVPPMMLATVLLSGALLFIAAIYESVTLILIA